MTRTKNLRRYLLAVALGALGGSALPMAAEAQAPAQPRAERGATADRMAMRRARARAERPGTSATALLNARRRLDLTPRQVMQLDSIERVQFAERRANAERMRSTMRAQRDTAQPRTMRRGAMQRGAMRRDAMRAMTPEQRAAMRDSMQARREAMRPEMERMRRADSTARAAAERVLTDAQRQQVREMQAEARGRAQGRREARRMQGARGARQMRGAERMRQARPMRSPRPGQG